ncbi:MAG: shikimate dehydrogenase [Chloroflexota bacterium]|nr:shikimate dehydrogenase [Chloroflexota bacterium]
MVSQAAQGARQVGLIGYPVGHSLSPAMHSAAFRELGLPVSYTLLPTAPEKLEEQVSECIMGGFAGWNVTVPHKEKMLAYLDEMSEEVRATGACNTVLVEHGRLLGYNTDLAGFMSGLTEAGGTEPGSHVVLLGAGGAARAVAWALRQAGHKVNILSRNPRQAEAIATSLQRYHPALNRHGTCQLGLKGGEGAVPDSVLEGSAVPIAHGTLDAGTLAYALAKANLLVNCTPAGMWPHIETSPLPDGTRLRKGMLVYDLVYRPRPTWLLTEARKQGCRTQDGLAMLVHQGAAAFEIWTGRTAPVDLMRRACLAELEKGE